MWNHRRPRGIDLLTLMTRGGAFMIPIIMMSFLVVALAVERLLNLRTRKIIPRLLVEDLQELTDPIERFNPTAAYQSVPGSAFTRCSCDFGPC